MHSPHNALSTVFTNAVLKIVVYFGMQAYADCLPFDVMSLSCSCIDLAACTVTPSSVTLPCNHASCVQGIKLLHSFLAELEQAPRRKQPEDLHRVRHVLESYVGRLGPEVAEWPALTCHPSLGVTSSLSSGPTSRPAEFRRPIESRELSKGHSDAADIIQHQSLGVYPGDSEQQQQQTSACRDATSSSSAITWSEHQKSESVHFQIDHVFDVTSVGIVVSGTAVRGSVEVGTMYWWGPNGADGEFTRIKVTSIHRSQVPVVRVSAGQCATLALDVSSASVRPYLSSALPRTQRDTAAGITGAGAQTMDTRTSGHGCGMRAELRSSTNASGQTAINVDGSEAMPLVTRQTGIMNASCIATSMLGCEEPTNPSRNDSLDGAAQCSVGDVEAVPCPPDAACATASNEAVECELADKEPMAGRHAPAGIGGSGCMAGRHAPAGIGGSGCMAEQHALHGDVAQGEIEISLAALPQATQEVRSATSSFGCLKAGQGDAGGMFQGTAIHVEEGLVPCEHSCATSHTAGQLEASGAAGGGAVELSLASQPLTLASQPQHVPDTHSQTLRGPHLEGVSRKGSTLVDTAGLHQRLASNNAKCDTLGTAEQERDRKSEAEPGLCEHTLTNDCKPALQRLRDNDMEVAPQGQATLSSQGTSALGSGAVAPFFKDIAVVRTNPAVSGRERAEATDAGKACTGSERASCREGADRCTYAAAACTEASKQTNKSCQERAVMDASSCSDTSVQLVSPELRHSASDPLWSRSVHCDRRHSDAVLSKNGSQPRPMRPESSGMKGGGLRISPGVLRPASPQLPPNLGSLHLQSPLSSDALRRLSESVPILSSSPEAMSLDAAWQYMGLDLAGLPSNACDSLPSKTRKGNVLIDINARPQATHTFRALMILTNSQWPARGLLSGRWPPYDCAMHATSPRLLHSSSSPRLCSHSSEATMDGLERQQSGPQRVVSQGRFRQARLPAYLHVMHCASVRQEVRVLEMQEVQHDLEEQGFEVQGVNLTAAAAAAAVLLHHETGSERFAGEDDDSGRGDREGALVDVTFQFTSRAEWLAPGMRFVTRAQLGHVSAVGVIVSIGDGQERPLQ
jgi:hypothetical protein